MKRRLLCSLFAGLALTMAAASGPAQAAWPERPITMVVPYAPGGTADALARLIAQYLGPRLNTSVVVINKAGASGVIGEGEVARAAGDGYTMLYDATPLSINPHLQKLPYDPDKDLQPVTLVGLTPMLVAVAKTSPHNTLKDLIAAARKSPGKLSFGSGGQGTVQYMGAELFAQAAGLKVLHVPYKSGGPALMATVSGEVDFGFGNLPALSPHIKSGSLKALAITSATRNPGYPDVPTIAEAAVKGFDVQEWNGIFVPGSTPLAVVAQLHRAVVDVLHMPEVKARFDALGSRMVASSPEEFRKFLDLERTRWAQTVKAAGIQKE